MKRPEHPSAAPLSCADVRRRIARRVADAHRPLAPEQPDDLLSFVSGSTVEDLADARSDVDMSVVLPALPDAAALQAACARAGGTPWFWTAGDLAEGSLVVAFHVDGIETQIGYSTHAVLNDHVDELLIRHNPDTPIHKLAEGILKAEALAGAGRLDAIKARLAAFPPELADAMLGFWLKSPTPWKAITQLRQRDAGLWCRELLVEAGYRMLGVLAALNRRYFTRFQVKRVGKLAASFAIAPPQLAARLDALLVAEPFAAFEALHALEAEVLALVALHAPHVDIAAARQRQADFKA